MSAASSQVACEFTLDSVGLAKKSINIFSVK